MMDPKQQAKLAMLKHVSGLMDHLVGQKLKGHKQPVAMHMEAEVMPAKKGLEPSSSSPESLMPKESESPMEEAHESPMQEKQEGDMEPEDMEKLHEMYSKLS